MAEQAFLQAPLKPPVVGRVELLTLDRESLAAQPRHISGAGSGGKACATVSSTCQASRLSTATTPSIAPVNFSKATAWRRRADAAGEPDDPVADLDFDRTRREPQQVADDVVEYVKAEVVVGPEEHLEQVPPGHDPDQRAAAVHYRQPLDVAVIHAPGRRRDELIGAGGHRRGGHQVGRGQACSLGPLAPALGGLEHRRVGLAQQCDLLQREIGLGDHPTTTRPVSSSTGRR